MKMVVFGMQGEVLDRRLFRVNIIIKIINHTTTSKTQQSNNNSNNDNRTETTTTTTTATTMISTGVLDCGPSLRRRLKAL